MNPPLRNVTLQQAIDAGYDCVQFKYRGPSTEHTLDGVVLLCSALPDVVHVYDCLSSHGVKATHFSYRDRYALAYVEVSKLQNPALVIARNFPIQSAPIAWKELDAKLHCGIIFRRSHGLFDDEVLCQRWYPEVPTDLL